MIVARSALVLFAFAATLIPKSAFAYPELVRHGYTNCTACHLSPSGGGVLTSYGRELSKEILSTWARDGEQSFAYGALTPDEKIVLGVFVRGVQAHRETEVKSEGRFILMQADAEAAYNSEKWAIAGTIGRQEIRSGLNSEGRFFSRRHYALYRPSDNWSIRAGKFLRSFGLNDPNHNAYVRRELNFGFDTETYNAELAFLGESWTSYLTYIDGSLVGDRYVPLKEKGAAWSLSYFFLEKEKVGLSVYRGEDDSNKRWVAGPWWILSFPPKFFLLSEIDFQERTVKATGKTQRGFVTTHRLGYEWVQGFIPFVSFDKKYLDRNDPTSEQNAYGLGIQFFPRPHWEIVASWQKEKLVQANKNSDLLWLMLHFYL
jgi:hypothetical protein